MVNYIRYFFDMNLNCIACQSYRFCEMVTQRSALATNISYGNINAKAPSLLFSYGCSTFVGMIIGPLL